MRSTLYLKFIILYVIFGFLSLFTAATLTSGLVAQPLERYIATNMYEEASLVASDYLPQYFSAMSGFSFPEYRHSLTPPYGSFPRMGKCWPLPSQTGIRPPRIR